MSDTFSVGDADHLDLDALADALAGEGDAASAAHLAGCRSCASRLRELEAAEQRVVAVLSTLPPPDVPADLADRLTAAFAAEAPLDPAATTTGATVTALPARDRRRTWLPAAAAAVLLASGAGIGWSVLGGMDGSDDASTADTAAGLPVNASGTDYADGAALTGSLPAVLAGTAAAADADAAALSTGSESRSDSSGGATAESDAAEAPAAATMSAPDPLDRLRSTDGLAACLAGLQDGAEAVEPLALDYASYAGAPALAVLLPDPDPAKVAVFVVGPECAQADPQLLHYVRVDRPE